MIINYPEVEAFYLVKLFFDCGAIMQTGMGSVALTWAEIESWQRQIGISLQAWEVKTLKAGSHAYAYQYSISNKENCAPPNAPVRREAADLQKHIKNILR